jgi:hypothetical protein
MTAIKLPPFIKKQPVAVVCALLCIGLALAMYFRKAQLVTLQADLDSKTSQGNHLKANVDSANSLTNKADKLEEQYAALTQTVQAIEDRLVHADQSKLATNKQYFYKIEEETQTELKALSQSGVSTSTKNSGKAYIGVNYTITVEGTYPQLLDFLRRVENGEHFARVKGLSLSVGGGGENTAKSSAKLSLNLDLELLGLP